MEAREVKGLEIAAKSKLQQSGDRWFVPSQTGHRGTYYTVKPDPAKPHCSCPDFETRQLRCKHLFAVEYVIQREFTYNAETQTETITETVTVKQTYKQEWSAYNQAQTHEKEKFLELLAELCKSIQEPDQGMGRKRLPLGDMIFASAFKVYSTVSGRRFMSDLRDAHSKGFLTRAAHYNSISRYLENPTLTPLLKSLIEASSLPLQSVESDFAVDSSGFSTSRFVQWFQAKHHDPKLLEARDWVKVHLMCGVKTNVVTAVEITDRFAGDSPMFKGLVETTARNFVMEEVSADKAYLSAKNLQTVVSHHAQPYIPFKSNSTNKDRWQKSRFRPAIWKQMFHLYSYNSERFMQSYHKRSNVETTFHMIKSKFGSALRSKTKTAQINEALCKVLCHNICCLIQSVFELGIDPTFWADSANA
ncbi:MAG: transposase [Pyrinomonadaceae bacterium]